MFIPKFKPILLLFLVAFTISSCNLCDIMNDLIHPDEDNTNSNTPEATTELEEKLYSADLMEINYRVAVYCIEEDDNPLSVYDLFDFDYYYGLYDSLHSGYSSDGLNYSITAGTNQVDRFILNELTIEVEFSEDHLYIERLHAYNDYDELNYIDQATRQLQYELTIEDPIRIVTTNTDSIEMMQGVSYFAEMNDSAHYEFWAKEIFKDDTQESVAWNYFDTKGTERQLRIELFFRIY